MNTRLTDIVRRLERTESRLERAGAESMSIYVTLIEKTSSVKLIHEAIEYHIEGLLLRGEHVPEPTALAEPTRLRSLRFPTASQIQ
jgi:hypothetical protein